MLAGDGGGSRGPYGVRGDLNQKMGQAALGVKDVSIDNVYEDDSYFLLYGE